MSFKMRLLKYPSGAAAAFLFFIFINSFSSGRPLVPEITLYVRNRCPFPIWPATAPNTGHPVIAGGGFYLPSGKQESFGAPWDWTGRIWARTSCNFSPKKNTTSKYWQLSACETGDCDGKLECNGLIGKPPVTLIELSLQKDKPHFYDVSLVDGYNIPVSVTNMQKTPKCTVGGCSKSLLKSCPRELQVLNKNGTEVVACKSACLAFDSDSFCCRNEYGSPDKCKPSVYSKMFKDVCPSYFSYAFDSPSPLVNCGGPDAKVFFITFCPSSWAVPHQSV